MLSKDMAVERGGGLKFHNNKKLFLLLFLIFGKHDIID